MNPQDQQRRIVIVDGDSAARELVRELLERNVECLHLWSARRSSTAGFDPAPYDADLGYAGDFDSAVQLIDELAPDAVVAGSDQGAVFAELIARTLNLPTHEAELIGARRRAIAALRLARRPSWRAANSHRPQFAVNVVCQDGRPSVTDAWRMLIVAGESGLRLEGFRLLEPELAETEGLLAFARGALDKLGILEGAAHAHLAWTAGGPTLIGAAACVAADPMDRAPYLAAGLNTQARMFASLLAGPQPGVDASLIAPRFRTSRHMTKVLFSFTAPAVIVGVAGLSRLRQLASFHSLHRPSARGERVRGSNGWLTEGGVLYLVHEEAEQISADARQFRLWESRGELYELATLAEGAG